MSIFIVLLTLMHEVLVPSESISEPTQFGCGTQSISSYGGIENDTINMKVGKLVFNNRCASCHNRNMKDHLTGPALAGVFGRFGNDTSRFKRYLNNSSEFMKREKDPRLEALTLKYEVESSHQFVTLSQNEIKSIILYIEAH